MISGYFLDTTGIIWQVPCLLECLVFFVLVRPLQNRRPLGWRAAWAAIALSLIHI